MLESSGCGHCQMHAACITDAISKTNILKKSRHLETRFFIFSLTLHTTDKKRAVSGAYVHVILCMYITKKGKTRSLQSAAGKDRLQLLLNLVC